MSDLVLPFLPIVTPSQAASLQIKRTSWRNVKKFIKALDKAKLVKSKERNGGETVVLDADFEDRGVLEFQPYDLPKKEHGGLPGPATRNGHDAGAADAAIGQQLTKVNLFRPKERLAPLLAMAKSRFVETCPED